MDYEYSELLGRARRWSEAAVAAQRLPLEQADWLAQLDSPIASSLFPQAQGDAGRPMIVAFMGGTGVGKSSLLNRLAGRAIAKAGIERPTSREVTLYHHRGLTLNELPDGLPLDRIKIDHHDDDARRHIVWIDMPDFDSVEAANQKLVLNWLPHIDVLLYVVSPERYRDGKAWRLLLAEGAKHAWLFVMNQWDRGQAAQYEDLRRQLALAGFADPLLFRTSCAQPDGDEFPALLVKLAELAGGHAMQQMQRRGERQRKQALSTTLRRLETLLAERDYPALQRQLETRWQRAETDLAAGLAWPLTQLAKARAEPGGQTADIKLWDDWAQTLFGDFLDDVALQASQAGIPPRPLRAALQDLRDTAGAKVVSQTELAGRMALLNPGNRPQRIVLRIATVAATALPLAAMTAVGYQVYFGYYRGATGLGAYLGSDFAIHSGLLIGLSWLIPYFLQRQLQPSLQKAAQRGLQKGLQQALAGVWAEIAASLRREQQENQRLLEQLGEIAQDCAPGEEEHIAKQSLLGRALPDREPA
ncbi:GTPase domain-containing protein [Methylococcaceae bacterium WWC4]|nr:GTPase domain-containing protein [Methylococcaceae bacterium WWC4]